MHGMQSRARMKVQFVVPAVPTAQGRLPRAGETRAHAACTDTGSVCARARLPGSVPAAGSPSHFRLTAGAQMITMMYSKN